MYTKLGMKIRFCNLFKRTNEIQNGLFWKYVYILKTKSNKFIVKDVKNSFYNYFLVSSYLHKHTQL